MYKNFDEWNLLKKKIDKANNFPFFSEREVWFVNLGLNVGYEQNGKNKKYLRPVIILRKFNNRLFWAIPLTGRLKTGRYYFIKKLQELFPRQNP